MATTVTQPNETEQMAVWVREYGPSLRAYLLAMVRNPHQADDLSQDVFCRAWQGRDRYQEQGYARAYLFRIADRVLCDSLRRKKPANLGDEVWSVEDVAKHIDPVEAVVDSETHAQLYQALDRLTAVQRRILLLRYFGQLGFQEIAETVDCPLNTALSHCRRGLEQLRGEFGENS